MMKMIARMKINNIYWKPLWEVEVKEDKSVTIWNREKTKILYKSSEPFYTYTWMNFYKPALAAIKQYEQ